MIKQFNNIKVWKRGGQRAPHKALLLLYVLAKYQQGSERLIPYSKIDAVLRSLLMEFGPPRKSYHPEYPFWRLQNDGIWETSNKEKVTCRKGSTDAKKSELFKYNVCGGLKEEVFQYLKENDKAIDQLANFLLTKSFPESVHEDLLSATGLSIGAGNRLTGRNPIFREQVIRAYEHKCAVCGYDVKLGCTDMGLEAAHIKWYMAGGPDEVQNGVALCVMHHKMFDRGAIAISLDYRIIVSQHVHGSKWLKEYLINFHGREINMPQSHEYTPEKEFLNWHIKEVFKGPAKI